MKQLSESETLDNNITVNVVITCDVVCPYKNKCISYPTRCASCRHNSGKRDYYEPEPYPYYPYPYNPWYPYTWPYTWWTTDTSAANNKWTFSTSTATGDYFAQI